jgi:hypothetical protein
MIVEPKREILLVPLLRAGLQRSWAARDHFLRLGIVPLVVLLAIDAPLQQASEAVLLAAGPGGLPQDSGQMSTLALLLIVGFAALSLFAVNWLRQLTLGMGAVPGLGLSIGTRHLRFFFMILSTLFACGALALTLVLVLSPFGLPGAGAGIMVSMLAWAVVIARISPSWIGIAIDAPMPLGVAWRRTVGQGFKLLIALLAIDVPLMFFGQLVHAVFALTGLLAATPMTFILISVVMQLAGTAVQLAILVTAFPYFLRETV